MNPEEQPFMIPGIKLHMGDEEYFAIEDRNKRCNTKTLRIILTDDQIKRFEESGASRIYLRESMQLLEVRKISTPYIVFDPDCYCDDPHNARLLEAFAEADGAIICRVIARDPDTGRETLPQR